MEESVGEQLAGEPPLISPIDFPAIESSGPFVSSGPFESSGTVESSGPPESMSTDETIEHKKAPLERSTTYSMKPAHPNPVGQRADASSHGDEDVRTNSGHLGQDLAVSGRDRKELLTRSTTYSMKHPASNQGEHPAFGAGHGRDDPQLHSGNQNDHGHGMSVRERKELLTRSTTYSMKPANTNPAVEPSDTTAQAEDPMVPPEVSGGEMKSPLTRSMTYMKSSSPRSQAGQPVGNHGEIQQPITNHGQNEQSFTNHGQNEQPANHRQNEQPFANHGQNEGPLTDHDQGRGTEEEEEAILIDNSGVGGLDESDIPTYVLDDDRRAPTVPQTNNEDLLSFSANEQKGQPQREGYELHFSMTQGNIGTGEMELKYSQNDLDNAIRRMKLTFEDELRQRELEWRLAHEERNQQTFIMRQNSFERIEMLEQENKRMKDVVSQYEAMLLEVSQNSRSNGSRSEEEIAEILHSKELLQDDLNAAEQNLFDAYRRIAKLKQAIDSLRHNEEKLKQNSKVLVAKIELSEDRYAKLRSLAMDKIDNANVAISQVRKQNEVDSAGLRASLKLTQTKVNNLEAEIEAKSIENKQLTQICDDLIAKVSVD